MRVHGVEEGTTLKDFAAYFQTFGEVVDCVRGTLPSIVFVRFQCTKAARRVMERSHILDGAELVPVLAVSGQRQMEECEKSALDKLSRPRSTRRVRRAAEGLGVAHNGRTWVQPTRVARRERVALPPRPHGRSEAANLTPEACSARAEAAAAARAQRVARLAARRQERAAAARRATEQASVLPPEDIPTPAEVSATYQDFVRSIWLDDAAHRAATPAPVAGSPARGAAIRALWLGEVTPVGAEQIDMTTPRKEPATGSTAIPMMTPDEADEYCMASPADSDNGDALSDFWCDDEEAEEMAGMDVEDCYEALDHFTEDQDLENLPMVRRLDLASLPVEEVVAVLDTKKKCEDAAILSDSDFESPRKALGSGASRANSMSPVKVRIMA